MVRYRGLSVGAFLLASTVAACGGPAQNAKPAAGANDAASKMLQSAGRKAESVVAAVVESLGMGEPKVAAKSPEPEPEPPPVKPVRRVVSRPVPVPEPEPAVAAEVEPAATIIEASVDQPDAVEDDLVIEAEEPGEPKPVDLNVYSAADVDVVPPTPPAGSPLRPWRTSTAEPGLIVEVTVGQDGLAEKVRMLGVVRLSDATILSQVKAWRFEPALRAGEPVRYRVLLEEPFRPR